MDDKNAKEVTETETIEERDKLEVREREKIFAISFNLNKHIQVYLSQDKKIENEEEEEKEVVKEKKKVKERGN